MRIGFIGGGAMSQAILAGIKSVRKDATLLFFDPDDAASKKCVAIGAVRKSSNVLLMQEKLDILFLCTKPNYIKSVLREVSSFVNDKLLLVSIAAGISLSSMEAELPKHAKVFRIMPNIACTVQCMAGGIIGGKQTNETDLRAVTSLLSSMGLIIPITNEEQMDAVTGLSGSGPAYVFLMIEALADGGVKSGLPRSSALQLAIMTVKGAAEMLLQSGSHPGVLKDQVCSPAGTTIAGISVLEQRATRSSFIDAVYAATMRSKELSKL